MPDKIISTAKSILNLTKYRVKRGHQKRPLQATRAELGTSLLLLPLNFLF